MYNLRYEPKKYGFRSECDPTMFDFHFFVMHLFLCHVLNVTIFLQELDTLGWQEKWKGNKKIQQVQINVEKILFFPFFGN